MTTACNQGESVQIVLSSDEAVVFFDWLARQNETDSLPIDHPAEQRVLWDLEAILETKLEMPFKPDYAELVQRARKAVIGE